MAADQALLLVCFTLTWAHIVFELPNTPKVKNTCQCSHFIGSKQIGCCVAVLVGGRCKEVNKNQQFCFVDMDSNCEDKTETVNKFGQVDRCESPDGRQKDSTNCQFLSFKACSSRPTQLPPDKFNVTSTQPYPKPTLATPDHIPSGCVCNAAEEKMFGNTYSRGIPCNSQLLGTSYCFVDNDTECEDAPGLEICHGQDCESLDPELLKMCQEGYDLRTTIH